MPQEMIRVGLVGVTGYTGMELARLLTGHPNMKLTAATSRTEAGKRLGDLYPFLNGLPGADVILIEPEPELIAKECDLAFLAVPHTAATEMAAALVERGLKVVDLSADFRLKSAETYEQWYKVEHKRPDLLPEAVYGLPELYASDIAKARLVANPGCYPTSIALGLAPAVKAGAIDPATLVIDSKSGATGAGRGLALNTHYTECNEAFAPYKVASHRHTPEIEQTLSELAGREVRVTFVPHLLAVNRGIVSTMYANFMPGFDLAAVRTLYEGFYRGEEFVRVLPDGAAANLKNVKYSNYCHISLHADAHTGRLIVVSTIDNMVKGAAGQAIQNMNIALGLEEDAGLRIIPPAF